MTTFKGHLTGFNRSGSNACVPDENGASTDFKGRGAVPSGKLQRVPSLSGGTASGNRRTAKASHGDGGGMATKMKGTNAFAKRK